MVGLLGHVPTLKMGFIWPRAASKNGIHGACGRSMRAGVFQRTYPLCLQQCVSWVRRESSLGVHYYYYSVTLWYSSVPPNTGVGRVLKYNLFNFYCNELKLFNNFYKFGKIKMIRFIALFHGVCYCPFSSCPVDIGLISWD